MVIRSIPRGEPVTVRRLIAIAFIFAGCSVAWFVLGSSVVLRTGEFDGHLSKEVALLWGGAHSQRAPEAAIARARETTDTVLETKAGTDRRASGDRTVTDWPAARLMSTDADVALDLEHRQKGLLWYDTFEVAFRGTYVFANPDDVERRMRFTFAFPAEHAIYDDFTITVDGVSTTRGGDLAKELITEATVAPRGRATFVVSYRSRGTGDWRYTFVPSGVADVRDFALVDAHQFSRHRLPRRHDVADGEGRDRRRLGADLAVHEPCHRAGDRHGPAEPDEPRPARVTDHVLCARLAAVLPHRDGRPRRAVGRAAASDELLLHLRGLLRLPPAAGVSRRSHFLAQRVHGGRRRERGPRRQLPPRRRRRSAPRCGRPRRRRPCTSWRSATRSSSKASRD